MCLGKRREQQRLRAQAAEDREEQRLRRERQREEEARQHDADKAAVEAEFSPEDRKSALLLLGKVALSYHDQRLVIVRFGCGGAWHDGGLDSVG